MYTKQLILPLAVISLASAQETVLGVYIYHRHGDRTTKSYPPTVLTDLGYYQVHTSGQAYNARYINSSSPTAIHGISSPAVDNSQVTVLAPADDPVLQNSAAGFLQGLYPPLGSTSSQTLANGSVVDAPLNGYQLIPVNTYASSTGSNSENSAWLQGSMGCLKAEVSSNEYFSSDEYYTTANQSYNFYQSLLPVINSTFTSATDTYKNAYTIYDYIHVSTIHNTSIPSSSLLTPDTLLHLNVLSNKHEFALAYNASSLIRAIDGSTLASQILSALNTTLSSPPTSSTPLSIQFGAYASFLSFFGLANLSAVNENFTGVVNYASSMVFELVTNASVTDTAYPALDEISVRFRFANGSAAEVELASYPLFGTGEEVLGYGRFVEEMERFAVGNVTTWCTACGNTTGVCAGTATSSGAGASGTAASTSGGGGSGISTAVGGVIGAMVTLAVVLGLEALVVLLGGLRVVSKRRLAGGNGGVTQSTVEAGKSG